MELLTCALLAVALSQAEGVKVTYQQRLDAAARLPAVFSPDGRRLLYFKQEPAEGEGRSSQQFVYCLANVDGSQPREIFRSPVDWDDYLNTVTSNSAFAADGRRIAVATTDNGRKLREENPGKVVPGIYQPGQKIVPVACELGSTGGFGFAGDDLVFLDTVGINSGVGYRLKINRGDRVEVIEKDDTQAAAFALRVSPDATRVVFYTSEQARSHLVKLRMVDLKTRRAVQSPQFRAEDVTFDGTPQLFWDAAGEGVFCHVSTNKDSKWPFELTHYRFDTEKGFVATPKRNIGASAVLDERHVSVWHPDARGCSVLRLPQRVLLSMPSQNYILGGRGNRVVVADLDRDAVYAAVIELPKTSPERQ